MTTLRVPAHAKVNLFLRILARESSGFHQVETAFALLELADELVLRRTGGAGGGISLDVQGAADLGPADENLAVRAARMLLDATGNRFGVAITLIKRIPVRAGLGGGSSDAAATLHAVNALAGNAVPRQELMHFATRLGADVAFFASGAPLALAWGRGERQLRLAAPPSHLRREGGISERKRDGAASRNEPNRSRRRTNDRNAFSRARVRPT